MRSISESEKLIMKVVWEANKDLATQELITILKEQYGKDYARTTVVTFVDRLKQKGYVTTQRIGKQSYMNNPGRNPSPVRRMEITNPFSWKLRFR